MSGTTCELLTWLFFFIAVVGELGWVSGFRAFLRQRRYLTRCHAVLDGRDREIKNLRNQKPNTKT